MQLLACAQARGIFAGEAARKTRAAQEHLGLFAGRARHLVPRRERNAHA